ncbi:iron chelate uptake ABC transporter family permease subunit [Rossellomorea sp. NS-SX7]|uniref:iron chelate uptake ABC transporter family permease subunit n=1 Tax=Rossellomorea sp. NS-SX7 TaxID=3463856 RepID=UPI0040585539
MDITIVNRFKLTRVPVGILVGASLAIAGAAFRGLWRGELADPYTLDMSSCVSVGA